MRQEFEYKQGILSAQFNNFACKLDNGYGHEARVQWLSTHFGGVKSTIEEGLIKSTLPVCYAARIETTFLEEILNPEKRMRISLQRVEAVGNSLQDSIKNLCDNVNLRLEDYNMLSLFLPKGSQTSALLAPDKEYHCIKNDDPLHDHNSEKLLDFISIDKTAITGRVRRYSYQRGHMHLVDPALI